MTDKVQEILTQGGTRKMKGKEKRKKERKKNKKIYKQD